MQAKCVSDVHMCACSDAVLDTSLSLSILIDKKLHILSPPKSDRPRLSGGEEVVQEGNTSPAPGTSKLPPQDEGGSNNILAYVSVLAAVVLGLLLYVAYKW